MLHYHIMSLSASVSNEKKIDQLAYLKRIGNNNKMEQVHKRLNFIMKILLFALDLIRVNQSLCVNRVDALLA